MTSTVRPDAIARRLPKDMVRRCQQLTDVQLGTYMDTATMELGQALDQWRFKSGPPGEVSRIMDTLTSLWVEVERRGLV